MVGSLIFIILLQLIVPQDGSPEATSASAEAQTAAPDDAAKEAAAPADSQKTSDAGTGQPASAPANPPNPAQDGGNPLLQFLPILIIGFFFYIILLRPQQREQRRRQDMLSNLKKNDKVVTTGGLIGTIADISSDGKQVTLRVDDTTRIKFLRSAIHGLAEDKSEPTTSSS